MTKELQEKKEGQPIDDDLMMKLVADGNMDGLSPAQKLQVYKARCDAAGLDPRTQPFQVIKLQGKETLYALKGATDQLASNHGIKVNIQSQVTENDIRTVTVKAVARDGRETEEVGCVNVQGIKGDSLANAMMKAVTKAKRRAILSLCGLGMLDETELETIPGASPVAGNGRGNQKLTIDTVTTKSNTPLPPGPIPDIKEEPFETTGNIDILRELIISTKIEMEIPHETYMKGLRAVNRDALPNLSNLTHEEVNLIWEKIKTYGEKLKSKKGGK